MDTLAARDDDSTATSVPEMNAGSTCDSDDGIACEVISNASHTYNSSEVHGPSQYFNRKQLAPLSVLPMAVQPTRMVVHDPRERFQALIQWLRKHGATFGKLDIVEIDSTNRGIVATEDVADDETLLYIPKNLIITSEVARSSEIGTAITKSGIQLRSKHSYIASFLLAE
uniref:Histone-lysine N-methyltransferase setd3 n=1 Tax=Lygus hesperus TaxID=30085 RepID=A0A0A9YC01_LYGHE